jgi:hypothetical protein
LFERPRKNREGHRERVQQQPSMKAQHHQTSLDPTHPLQLSTSLYRELDTTTVAVDHTLITRAWYKQQTG